MSSLGMYVARIEYIRIPPFAVLWYETCYQVPCPPLVSATFLLMKKSTRVKIIDFLFDGPVLPFLLIIGFGLFATVAGTGG